jgi:hypothetical protein
MKQNILNLEDLGDEIMVLEGLSGAITAKSILSKMHEGDFLTVAGGAILYGSLATAVFSQQYRRPALITAAVSGVFQVGRAIMAVRSEA